MKEKTKELKNLSDIENIVSEKEPTKKINTVEEIENIEEFHEVENKDKTKELTNTDNTTEEKTNSVKTSSNKNNSSKKNKKKFILLGIIIAIIIIICIVLYLLLNNSSTEEEDTHSKYYKTIENALDSGKLSSEFESIMKKLNLSASAAEVISIDINSDNKQDLVAYIEDDNSKYLIYFQVDGGIYYEDSYNLTNKNSFGYTYSINEDKSFWYTEYNNQYTVISDSKKIMSQEEFENNYYIITNKYKNIQILDNSEEYDLDIDLDIDALEKNKLTSKKLLKNNNLDYELIKEKATNYLKEKEEEQEKEEEEEKKAKEEEKKNSSVEVNGYTIKFGTYELNDKESYVISASSIATHTKDELKEDCTWVVGTDFYTNEVLKVTCSNNIINLYPTVNGLKDVDGNEFIYKSN